MDNRCICCGEIIPEGREVCPNCEAGRRRYGTFRKKHGRYDLRKEVAVWVEKNIGAEYIDEALDKYDKLNSGVSIGGFQETAVFLHMIEQVKAEALN